MQNNDLVKNMEFIMKQLNMEWERSGEAKKEVIADRAQIERVVSDIARKVGESEGHLAENLTLVQSVNFSHNNYVRLRTIRKFMAAKRRQERYGSVFERILLDKEEMKVYADVTAGE